jgi:hypothetical protein
MNQRFLADIVSEYSDTGIAPARLSAPMALKQRQEVDTLLATIRMLRLVLIPVRPSPEFEALLRAELMAASMSSEPTGGRSMIRMVIGAVAVSSLVSAAAIYYVVARSRGTRKAA